MTKYEVYILSVRQPYWLTVLLNNHVISWIFVQACEIAYDNFNHIQQGTYIHISSMIYRVSTVYKGYIIGRVRMSEWSDVLPSDIRSAGYPSKPDTVYVFAKYRPNWIGYPDIKKARFQVHPLNVWKILCVQEVVTLFIYCMSRK